MSEIDNKQANTELDLEVNQDMENMDALIAGAEMTEKKEQEDRDKLIGLESGQEPETEKERKSKEQDIQIASTMIYGGLAFGISGFAGVEITKELELPMRDCALAYAQLTEKYIGVDKLVGVEAQALGSTVLLVMAVSGAKAQQKAKAEEDKKEAKPVNDPVDEPEKTGLFGKKKKAA